MDRYSVIVLLVLLLTSAAGCLPRPASTEAVAIKQSATPTHTPQSTASSTHTPSPTPKPTHTPTTPPTHTPTPTQSPSSTPSPTLTQTPILPTDTPTPSSPATGSISVRAIDGMEMVYVPEGEFLMGSPDGVGEDDEHPQHTVYLDAFWIDKTEVTNAQFTKCMDAGACAKTTFDDTSNFDADQQPVVDVDWFDAVDYCEWAGGRLPTEAEWEKAARGTDGRKYPWGDETANCDYAVIEDDSGNGCGRGSWAWEVGSKPAGASPYGALDMAGNVWEWVADSYDADYYSQSPENNPQGPEFVAYKGLRGGSWRNITGTVRAAYRGGDVPGNWFSFYGFRCVAESTSSP